MHAPGGKNLFGCDTHGTMALKEISGVAPTTGSGATTVINSAFPATFQRTVFEVVPYDPNTSDHIPGSEAGAVGGVDIEQLFGASGFVCSELQGQDRPEELRVPGDPALRRYRLTALPRSPRTPRRRGTG